VPVPSPSPAGFQVVAVQPLAADPSQYSGPCPTTVVFTFAITTDGPGTVQFEWVNSSGTVSTSDQADFAGAGTQQVSTRWTTGSPGTTLDGWMALRTTFPNHVDSDHAVFKLTCSQ
jgi:hypothetical protein